MCHVKTLKRPELSQCYFTKAHPSNGISSTSSAAKILQQITTLHLVEILFLTLKKNHNAFKLFTNVS